MALPLKIAVRVARSPPLIGMVASAHGEDMRAYVAPSTGRLVPEPVVPDPSRARPAPALPAAEVAAPGGGMMVRLNGRFMSSLVATVNPDGTVRMDCVTGDGPHAPAAE